MENVINALRERGFIEAITSEELVALANKPLKVYCGFDPTAESLHLGNLVPIMGLAWFQRFGHTPVAIVGGATGMIGDPGGRKQERQLLDEETIRKNLKGIEGNLRQILDFNHPTAKPILLNNYDWFKDFSFIDFLRDVGKHFRLGTMLAKDSVRDRLESEEGLSFTEFSYQLLQGYDFWHLYKEHGVTVQLGGSDQWGNITAGKDYIRKMGIENCHGMTFPLLVKQDGQKFGKSEKGAIWLSPEKLSPYEFYQHLVRVADADVIMLMRMLTFMDMGEIRAYEVLMKQTDYEPNTAQKRLAAEVTKIVHGEEALQLALRVTEFAKPGSESVLNGEILENISKDMPSTTLSKEDLLGNKIIDILVKTSLLPSKGEARRMVQSGGIYLNNQKISDENLMINQSHLIENRFLILSVGKKNKILVNIL